MTLQIQGMDRTTLIDSIFSIDDNNSFKKMSLAVYNYQYHNCYIYKRFCDILQRTPENVNKPEEIPFMPVDFFRHHSVTCIPGKAELRFYSSATSESVPSKHIVAYARLYKESIIRCFKMFFKDPSEYCILALLPGYLERSNASLIYMVKKLMEWSGHKKNGFFLYEHNKLKKILEELMAAGNKVLLIGVSHALLDFAESYPLKLNNVIIVETGGMKGQRKEIIRKELHGKLKKAFGISEITSEYGMTELLSQAYALKSGKFKTPPWMKVFFREINDPFTYVLPGKTGAINVIDLANVFSCSFIATNDIGKQNKNSTFEVLGRIDNSEMRGCNLMIA